MSAPRRWSGPSVDPTTSAGAPERSPWTSPIRRRCSPEAWPGGIWRSTDDGASWSLRTSPGQIHGTTSHRPGRRAGRTGTWYVGTGEIRGSTTNATRWGSLYLRRRRSSSPRTAARRGRCCPRPRPAPRKSTDAFDYVDQRGDQSRQCRRQDEVLAATCNGNLSIHRWRRLVGASASLPTRDITDIAVTPTGVMYAVTRVGALVPRVALHERDSPGRSSSPERFPTIANRIVIGLAPSNPNVVVLLRPGREPIGRPAGHQLWKYTYVSGDGSGAGGTWENRGDNLPSRIINTQGGYDMTIQVKPDDENFVIIGGTESLSLDRRLRDHRATTTVIGGYPFYPDGNHHPDLHAGAFTSGFEGIYYSAGDGGISQGARHHAAHHGVDEPQQRLQRDPVLLGGDPSRCGQRHDPGRRSGQRLPARQRARSFRLDRWSSAATARSSRSRRRRTIGSTPSIRAVRSIGRTGTARTSTT